MFAFENASVSLQALESVCESEHVQVSEYVGWCLCMCLEYVCLCTSVCVSMGVYCVCACECVWSLSSFFILAFL